MKDLQRYFTPLSRGPPFLERFTAERIAGRGRRDREAPNRCQEPRDIDRHLYKERNVAERFWSKAKQDRRVATRGEKKAVNFLSSVQVDPIPVRLR